MSIRGLLIFMHSLIVNRLTVIMDVCNSEPRSLQIYKTYSILENTWNIAPLIPFVGCWSCVRYGQKFGKVAKKGDYAGSDFEPLISEFLAHWNREHKGITREIKRSLDGKIH